MSDLFDPVVLIGYSILLAWVVDFIGKIPKISCLLTGWVKQLLAGVIGVVFCLMQKVSVFSGASTSEYVISGLVLAAVAGMGWSKLSGVLSNLKDMGATNGVTGSTDR